jgi:asparaginyl-tRNA synthetase
VQGVVSKADVTDDVWTDATRATQESTLEVTGLVRADARSPGGVEIAVTGVKILDLCRDWPITPKEHGVDFLLSQRHLWLRSSKQVAILKVRSEVESAIHDFFYARGYTKVDSPILTPNACEGTSSLFETEYTEEEKAYLSQSGQLYLEPAAAALGKVYCFGPTFRAEKSKTRRHLREFWMVEPEVAFLEIDGLMDLAEEFVKELSARVLDRRKEDLKRLERDVTKLEPSLSKPFPR